MRKYAIATSANGKSVIGLSEIGVEFYEPGTGVLF